MEKQASEKKSGEEKFTLIDSLITAMFVPKEYHKLLKLSSGKVVRYIAVLLFLVCLIQYAIPTLGSIAGLGGVEGILLNEIPEFSLEDGKFYLEEKLEKADEVSGVYFVIDTTVDAYTREDVPKNMIQAVMVSESNMLVYNSVYGLGGMVETQSFENLKGYSISNQTVADMSGVIYICLFFLFILLWFAAIVEYLVSAAFYALFMFILVKAFMQDLRFETVYKVTVFAQTIGAIVEAITYCLGIELLYMAGGFFNVFVTVVLMNKVILQFKMNDMQQ